MKVISFNILAQPWIDNELKREAIHRNDLKRECRICRQVEFLHYSNADLILLQEATPLVISAFKKRLPQYEILSCFSEMCWQPMTPNTPKNGNAILWKRDRIQNPKCQIIELHKISGNNAAMVTGTDSKTGYPIKIISLHLEYGNIKLATEQFNGLFRKNHITAYDGHVIIGGDFNMGEPKYPLRGIIHDNGFKECLSQSLEVKTHPFFNGPDSGSVSHILVRGFSCKKSGVAVQEKLLKSKTPIGDCLRIYGSDHYPIFAFIIPHSRV